MTYIPEIQHRLVNGVVVITSEAGARHGGLTIAWLMPVCVNPLMIAFSMAPERYSHKIVIESKKFVVNILREDQVEMAKHFGLKSGYDIDKFAGISMRRTPSGQPCLADCLAWMDCELESTVTAGNHNIFVGTVKEERMIRDGIPMIMDYKKFFS